MQEQQRQRVEAGPTWFPPCRSPPIGHGRESLGVPFDRHFLTQASVSCPCGRPLLLAFRAFQDSIQRSPLPPLPLPAAPAAQGCPFRRLSKPRPERSLTPEPTLLMKRGRENEEALARAPWPVEGRPGPAAPARRRVLQRLEGCALWADREEVPFGPRQSPGAAGPSKEAPPPQLELPVPQSGRRTPFAPVRAKEQAAA